MQRFKFNRENRNLSNERLCAQLLLQYLICELLLYTFNCGSVFPMYPRVYQHSVSITSTLMDVDTESTPLANPGSSLLQMNRGVSSAADAFEIQCDSTKPDGLKSLTHISGRGDGQRLEVVTELARSYSDSKQAAQQAPLQDSLYCVSNYLPGTGSAIGHLVLD